MQVSGLSNIQIRPFGGFGKQRHRGRELSVVKQVHCLFEGRHLGINRLGQPISGRFLAWSRF
jgi:hypothetical protein